MDEHANTADVAFPAAELLMERGVGHDLSVGEGEEGKIAAKVNILAPVMNDFGFSHAMLDEHPFMCRHSEEELVERRFIGRFERPHVAAKAVFGFDGLWELIQYVFQGHSSGRGVCSPILSW